MSTARVSSIIKNGTLAAVVALASLPLAAQAEGEAADAGSVGLFGLPVSVMNFEANGAYYLQGKGTDNEGGSVGTFDFGWRPEYRINESLTIPVRVMFTMLKDAQDEEDTTDDTIFFSAAFTVGADYAVVPNVLAGLDVGVHSFNESMSPLFGLRGQYKLGFAEDSILKLIDAVQVSYHYMMSDGAVQQFRAGVVVRF